MAKVASSEKTMHMANNALPFELSRGAEGGFADMGGAQAVANYGLRPAY